MLFLLLLITTIILTLGFNWYYDTAVGRIPIFMLGILCYPYSKRTEKLFIYACIAFFSIFLLDIVLYRLGRINTYVLLYMLSPLCLLLVGWFLQSNVCVDVLKRFFQIIGKYSLEIYVANVIVVLYRKAPENIFVDRGLLMTVFLYFLFNLILSFILAVVNIQINKVIKTT